MKASHPHGRPANESRRKHAEPLVRPVGSVPRPVSSAIQLSLTSQLTVWERARFGTGASLACILLTLGLAACGGDDAPTVIADNDTLTLTAGQGASLLANDLFSGNAATTGATGNVVFALSSGTLPAGVTAVDGQLAVDASTAPGSFSFGYTICDAADRGNCASATVQLTVPPPAIVALGDTVTLAAGESADLLVSDTLGGSSATAATVVVTAASLPPGMTLSTAGLLSVDATAVAGTYTFRYNICQVSVPDNCASATASVTVRVPALGSLTGRAVDSTTGLGIPGVVVSSAGLSALTDAGGNFSIAGLPASNRLSVVFTASNYGETARIASVVDAGTSNVQVRLVPVGTRAVADAVQGSTVSVPGSPAQAVVEAGTLQRMDGSAPSGSITVLLTPIDPSSDTTLMPGDFTALISGLAASLETFGALIVRIVDQAGAPLALQAGRTVGLRVPLATRSGAAPATVPMFYFDEASARWVQRGTASLAGTGAGRYYQAHVDRLGTWTAGQSYSTVNVSGCVANAAGARVAGASVVADGIDYSGSTVVTTDAGGNFVLPVRQGGRVAVTGLSVAGLTNTAPLGPYTADTSVADCLALGQAGAGVTMKLTWGAAPRDLDAHLYAPDGSRVYFAARGNLTSTPFAKLDVDDLSAFGPEVITVARLMVGTYKYAVNNYSGQSSARIGASGARVELNVPGRAVELFAPPSTGETSSTNWWNLFEFDVAANCTVTVRRVSAFATAAPVAAPSGVPTYCTAQ